MPFLPVGAYFRPNLYKIQNGTVFDHAASNGEDRKSLSIIVSEIDRGCRVLTKIRPILQPTEGLI